MVPNRKGYFDGFGGKFVPETLMAALTELDKEYQTAKKFGIILAPYQFQVISYCLEVQH